MESNDSINYIPTNISNLSLFPQAQENNFISILKMYETQYKDIEQNKLLKNQNNIFAIDYILQENKNNQNSIHQNPEDMQDVDDSINENSKLVEISANGTIQIKNNQNLNKRDSNIEDSNNILDFDDKAESIFMNNNQFFINNSSNKNNRYNKNNTNNNKADNFSDFFLQDIPININDENYYKWKKFSTLYKGKYNNLYKKSIFSIINKLISLKKNNGKNNKIEMIEINYNQLGNKIKHDANNEDISMKNIYSTNSNKNSIRDSTDSRASYENISNIITTTQINHLSNSSEFKNTINNINININNSKLYIPPQVKYDECNNLSSSKKRKKNNYQKTDVSKLYPMNNILNDEKFKSVINYLQYKDYLFMQKLNNNNSSNVRLNLDSGTKNKELGILYQINEEENESYDSLSLHKSIINSGKVTPNKIDLKKNSFTIHSSTNSINNTNNNSYDLNKNLNNVFNNKDKHSVYKQQPIEEINLGNADDEEDEKKNENNFNNNNIKENKIISIDLDMKNNYKNKENENNENNINEEDEIKVKENDEEEKNDNDNDNDNEDENEEKVDNIDNLNEDKKNDDEGDKNLEKNEEDNIDNIEKMDISENDNDINESKEIDENNIVNYKENKENDENNIVNYNTPDIREKSNDKLYDSIKCEDNNNKKQINTFNDKNDHLQFSDFNDIINNTEEKNESNENKDIQKNNNNIDNNINLMKIDENDESFKKNKENEETFKKNNENDETFKKNMGNDEEEINNLNINENKDKEKQDEEIIFSVSNINYKTKDSLNQHIKTPKSSCEIDFGKESENNKEIKILEPDSNSKSTNTNLNNDFMDYKVIKNKKLKLLFCYKNNDNNYNLINNKNTTVSIPLQSYIYILQLCLKKNLPLTKKYEMYIQKLLQKLNRSQSAKIEKNIKKNDKNDSLNENEALYEINDFELQLKYLKKLYIYLICKRSNLKSKKEKEKILANFDFNKKIDDTTKLFNNVLLLIDNKKNNKNRNAYINKIRNILKKYEKISKSEVAEGKTMDKQKLLGIPEKEISDNSNMMKEFKKGNSKKFYFISSIILPLIYISNYFFLNLKSNK